MSTAKENKLNLDLFIQKAIKISEERKKPFELEIEDFGAINFNYPKQNQLLNYMDSSVKGVTVDSNGVLLSQDFGLLVEAAKEFVYACCPYLQSDELHKALDLKDPFDAPIIIFGLDKTMEIASQIAEIAQGKKIIEKVVEEVKN